MGILDADIYGPSQPTMMGIEGRPESADGKTMEPMENYGVQVMSIGFLVDADNPMIWRGPMATQALEQLLRQTNWAELDYLLVDMPPGTGDIQLTLSQRVPLTGAVIVTTPQDIALLDAKRGLKMFEKVGVPILGIVENMAVHVCSNCGHAEHIFGADGGQRMAAEYGVDYLGALPLTMSIREQADAGRPTVVSDPDGEIAAIYKQRRAPDGGEDRAAREGLLVQVPDHLDLQDDLTAGAVMDRPAIELAVVMEREAAPNRWEAWRHRPVEVLLHEAAFGNEPRVLRDDGRVAAHAASGLAARAVPRRVRGLPPQPHVGRAGVVRDVAQRRRRPVARLARDRQRVVPRGRPLARRAGARRQPAAARANSWPGCRPSPTSTIGPSRSSAGVRPRSWRPRSAGREQPAGR